MFNSALFFSLSEISSTFLNCCDHVCLFVYVFVRFVLKFLTRFFYLFVSSDLLHGLHSLLPVGLNSFRIQIPVNR